MVAKATVCEELDWHINQSINQSITESGKVWWNYIVIDTTITERLVKLFVKDVNFRSVCDIFSR